MKFRNKITLAVVTSILFFNIVFSLFFINREMDREESSLNHKISQTNTLMKTINAVPLWSVDLLALKSNMDLIFNTPEVVAVYLEDVTGVIQIDREKDDKPDERFLVTHDVEITKKDITIGKASIVYSKGMLQGKMIDLILEKVLFTLGLIILTILVIFFITRYLVRPVNEIIEGLKKVDRGDFSSRLNITTHDEFKEIETYFNKMVSTINTEVGSRKEKEKELLATRNYLSTVFNSLSSMLISVNEEGKITHLNAAAENFTGVSASEVSKYIQEVVPFIKDYQDRLNDVISENQATTLKINNSETGQFFNMSISPVIFEGEKGAVIRLDDVTELEKKDQQLQQARKMETIGRLAGGIAHDFNNMLNVIIGHSDMLIQGLAPSSPAYSGIEKIREAACRSAELTKQLLAFARKQPIAPRPVSLNEAISEMMNMLQRLISEDISLNFYPEKELWRVSLDPAQIDQIMANLCINARDAISGAGNITIKTKNLVLDQNPDPDENDFKPGEYVALMVIDNGGGMDKETLQTVFEPFFTTKQSGKGAGLGLATVYGIVKQNNGLIDIDSEPGYGTSVKIYLPRHVDAAQCITTGHASAEPLHQGHETILIAEDEGAILEIAVKMLEHLGYTVLAASTPREAIRLAREHHGDIDLLITDVVMPEINGRELVEIIKSEYPEIKSLYISGYTADVIADRGVLNEDVDFLSKPFTISELSSALRNLLKNPAI